MSTKRGQEILQGIDYDFSQLKVPTGTWLSRSVIRAKQFDDYASEFLNSQPDSVIVHLGCGLDSRCMRVDNGRVEWYDLDLPDVIELRNKFFEETERYHMLAASATDLAWMSAIEIKGRPVMVIAEGLMMYLQEGDVKTLIQAIQTRLGARWLVFDAYSQMTAKRAHNHPSLKKTGAVIQWGIDDAHEIRDLGRRHTAARGMGLCAIARDRRAAAAAPPNVWNHRSLSCGPPEPTVSCITPSLS